MYTISSLSTGKTIGWGMGILAREVLGSEDVIATCWSALRCVFKFMIALSSANHYRILKCI